MGPPLITLWLADGQKVGRQPVSFVTNTDAEILILWNEEILC